MPNEVTTGTPQKIKTRDKLLDVAEALFSERGFDGVSIRDITDVADARLASVNYHFKTKQNLFMEVIARRANVLNADRKTELEAIDLDSVPPRDGVRAIALAFIHPMFVRSTQGGQGWKNYCRLIAQQAALRNSPNITGQFFNTLALELIQYLQKALPTLGHQHAHFAFQYLVGATIYLFTENERMDVLSDGKYSSHDLDALCDKLVDFATGGILALARQ